jgi:hypothetical protein
MSGVTVISSVHNLVFPEWFREKYGEDFWIEDGKPLATKRPITYMGGVHFLEDVKTILVTNRHYDTHDYFDFVCVHVDTAEVYRITLPLVGIGTYSLSVSATWLLREGERFESALEIINGWNENSKPTIRTTGTHNVKNPPNYDKLFNKP